MKQAAFLVREESPKTASGGNIFGDEKNRILSRIVLYVTIYVKNSSFGSDSIDRTIYHSGIRPNLSRR